MTMIVTLSNGTDQAGNGLSSFLFLFYEVRILLIHRIDPLDTTSSRSNIICFTEDAARKFNVPKCLRPWASFGRKMYHDHIRHCL